MKKFIFYGLLFFTLFFLLFFIVLNIEAQDSAVDGKTLYSILKKIGASDDQIKKVIQIYTESLQKIRPLRIQLQRLSLDFEEEYLKTEPDQNKLMDILTKIANVELEIKKIQVLAELEIRKVLGYELFMKFKTLWEQAKKK
jgi:hypothetical protein